MISRGRCPSIKRNQPCYADVTVDDEFTGEDGFALFCERIEKTGGLYIFKGEYPQVDKDLLSTYGEPKIYSFETILLLDGKANRAQEALIASEKTVNPIPDSNGLFHYNKMDFGSYEEALSQFCYDKTERWKKLIDERMGEVPDYVLQVMSDYDIYMWNGLNHDDWI